MTAIQLSNEQQALRDTIESILTRLKVDAQNRELAQAQREALYQEMGGAAHQLHMSLNPRPPHFNHMISNRGMQSDDPQFYVNIHSTEDLIDYLNGTHVVPQDVTLLREFHMDIHSNRWGHLDRYTLIRTTNGWEVTQGALSGTGDLEAYPILTDIMTHDSISYPRDIGSYMYSIWNQAANEGLSHEDVQQLLNQLADWISNCERNSPQHILD